MPTREANQTTGNPKDRKANRVRVLGRLFMVREQSPFDQAQEEKMGFKNDDQRKAVFAMLGRRTKSQRAGGKKIRSSMSKDRLTSRAHKWSQRVRANSMTADNVAEHLDQLDKGDLIDMIVEKMSKSDIANFYHGLDFARNQSPVRAYSEHLYRNRKRKK